MSEQFRQRFIAFQIYARRHGERCKEQARKKAEQRADEVAEKLWDIIEQTNRKRKLGVDIPRELDFDDELFELLHKSFYDDGVTLLMPDYNGDKYKMRWDMWV